MLTRLLQRRDSELRRHAARALGDCGGGEDVEAALAARLGDDSDSGVRTEAAWSLGKLKGGPASLLALERALSSPAAELRANAAAALARLGHAPEPLQRLLLHDPDVGRARQRQAGPRPRKQGRRRRPRGRNHDFIGLYLVDFDGAPLAGARYRLLLPDGLIKAGQADPRGVVREESLPHGACQIELVDEPAGRS